MVPQCVISNHEMSPSCLQRHLHTKHPGHKEKLLSFFQSKKDYLKKLKITCKSKCFRQSSSAEIVEASFEIVHVIAKEKKPNNIGEHID